MSRSTSESSPRSTPEAAEGTGVPAVTTRRRWSLTPRLLWRQVRRPLQWWRESLPLRVVATTFLASVLILLLGGVLLMEQASAGVREAKRQSSVLEAQAAINNAQNQLYATGTTTSNVSLVLS